MVTQYPGAIDGYSNIRIVRDGIDEILANDSNSIRSAIIAIEQTLGVNPQSVYGTVGAWIQHLNDLYDVGLPPSGPAGGDLSGTYPDPSVVGLQGHAVSSTAPTASYVLAWSGLEWVPSPSSSPGGHLLGGVSHLADTLANLNLKLSDCDLISTITVAGGDLSGTYPNPVVAQIEGYGVSPSQPTDGYGLTWNDGASQWESNKPIPGGTAAGDLRGFYPNPGVSGLQGRDVSSAAPTDGYGLTWNDGASQWESNKPIPGGVAAGDLSGTYPKPVVAKIQTRDVEAGAPTDGYGLTWNDGASQWESNKPIPGGPGGGDLRGFYPNPGVSGLQGRDVSSAAPNDSDVLTWNDGASQWEPATTGIPAAHALGGSSHSSDTLANLNLKISDADLISDITTAGGDLSGTYPNPIVDRQRGFYTYLDDYGSLPAAVSAIGANHKGLFINTNTTVSADLIIPSNISLLTYEGAGIISIDSGKILTINGPFNAGLYQVFTGSGNVVFGLGVMKEVYPQWWGAIVDGVQDTQPAIQKALDSLPTATDMGTYHDQINDAYGGIVKLSSGTWKINSPIQIYSFKWIFGSGPSTLIVNYSDSTPAIKIGDGITAVFRVHIKNLTIHGSGITHYVAGGYGIYAQRLARSYIGPIWISHTTDDGMWIQGAAYSYIKESYIKYNYGRGIHLTGAEGGPIFYLTATTVEDCTIRGNYGPGIQVDDAVTGYIVNNTIELNNLVGTKIGTTGYQTVDAYNSNLYLQHSNYCVVENNYFEHGFTYGIAGNVTHISLSGCTFNRVKSNYCANLLSVFVWSDNTISCYNYFNENQLGNLTSPTSPTFLIDYFTPGGGGRPTRNILLDNWNLSLKIPDGVTWLTTVSGQGTSNGLVTPHYSYTHISGGTYYPDFGLISGTPFVYGGIPKGPVQYITLQSNINIDVPVNPTATLYGQVIHFIFLQDGVGGRTVTFNPTYYRGTFSNIDNTANRTSCISFYIQQGMFPLPQVGVQTPWDSADIVTGIRETNNNLAIWSNKASGPSNTSVEVVANVNSATIDPDHKITTFYWRDDVGTKHEVLNVKDGEIQLNSTSISSMFSDQIDGGSSIAIRLGSTNSFVTAGAKLLSVVNGDPAGLERLSVDYRGDIICNQGDNLQSLGIKYLSELTTINADIDGYSVIEIPANSIVIAVSVRVVVTIPTASVFSVGVIGEVGRYASGLSTTAGITFPGTLDALRYYAVATPILFKPDITPSTDAGRVRTTIHYIEIIPPTS